jgi:hypothetical protein
VALVVIVLCQDDRRRLVAGLNSELMAAGAAVIAGVYRRRKPHGMSLSQRVSTHVNCVTVCGVLWYCAVSG